MILLTRCVVDAVDVVDGADGVVDVDVNFDNDDVHVDGDEAIADMTKLWPGLIVFVSSDTFDLRFVSVRHVVCLKTLPARANVQ